MKIQEIIKENPGIIVDSAGKNDQLIKELFRNNINASLEIKLKVGELFEFGQQIADRTVITFLQKHDEKVYSRKEVVEKFGICETTLWRWDKMGLIESKKIGNRVFYPESEIKRLMSQKGGAS